MIASTKEAVWAVLPSHGAAHDHLEGMPELIHFFMLISSYMGFLYMPGHQCPSHGSCLKANMLMHDREEHFVCTFGMLHKIIDNLLWIALTQEVALAVGNKYVSLDPFTKFSQDPTKEPAHQSLAC